MNNERFVITGAPSTGKSTVIKSLSEHHKTFGEAARIVIQEQLKAQSNKVPWLDNYEFSKLVAQQQIKDHEKNENRICQFGNFQIGRAHV